MTFPFGEPNDPMSRRGTGICKIKVEDGRRNNKPPIANRIQPGEIRNPHGRGGKPKPIILSEFDEHYIAEAARIVSRDANGLVNGLQRLIQEEWHSAFKNGDEKVRARVLKEIKEILARSALQQGSAHRWIIDCKLEYEAIFSAAKAVMRLPPDVLHPDHVIIIKNEVEFCGPIERQARKAWEVLKSAIKVAAVLHEQARKRIEWDASSRNLDDLKAIEKHRRMLMRKVPKGWNWREEVYTCHADAKIAADAIKFLKEQWDAECKTRDRVLARRKRKGLPT